MYEIQLKTELTIGAHNVTRWVQEEIANINQSDTDLALQHAKQFLTLEREDLEQKARIEEIVLIYGLAEASQLIVNALLETIILIKPEILVRGGREVVYHGVSPMQAVATSIGLQLNSEVIDAVQTGIELLSHFEPLGIYDVRIVREADRAVNRGGHIEVAGDSAVIAPTLSVNIELYKRIKFTQYLPPMLVKPLEY